MTDVLKKPVHLAILRPTQLEKLAEAGVVRKTEFGLDPNKALLNLPKEASTTPKLSVVAPNQIAKQQRLQIRLRVLHQSIPPASPTPPCDSCRTAACCHVFLVNITKDEYESGLYGDAAVKITPEISEQLKSTMLMPMVLGAPIGSEATTHYLEGKIGEPCPFLRADKKCGIYDIRPATCRSYSCVGDPRITDKMRISLEE